MFVYVEVLFCRFNTLFYIIDHPGTGITWYRMVSPTPMIYGISLGNGHMCCFWSLASVAEVWFSEHKVMFSNHLFLAKPEGV